MDAKHQHEGFERPQSRFESWFRFILSEVSPLFYFSTHPNIIKKVTYDYWVSTKRQSMRYYIAAKLIRKQEDHNYGKFVFNAYSSHIKKRFCGKAPLKF